MKLLVMVIVACLPRGVGEPDALSTVAERSDFTATSTYDEVVQLVERIDAESRLVRVLTLGETVEGRSIPLLVIADPPVETAEAARASGKAVVFAFGNIHAGEVCGKEALLMLARDLTRHPEPALLDRLVVVLCPIFNADSNQPMDVGNRPGQVGPEQGMGRRPNAQGLDLNRDYVKLESPEVRALVRFLTDWDPHLTVDTHTTNGSHHRYTLTYDYPLNPSGHPAPIAFVRDRLLPDVATRLRERSGYDTFFYGNFNRARTAWTTYSADPRFGGPYLGLRGQMSVLSEAYAYAPYRDRVLCTYEFVAEILSYVAEHRDDVLSVHARARLDTTAAGQTVRPDDIVGLRHRPAAWPSPAVIRGYEEVEGDDGRPRPTDRPHDYPVVHLGRFEPTLSVRRPFAYLVEPGHDRVVENLRRHGIEVESCAGRAEVEQYVVTSIERARREFQGHHLLTLEVDARRLALSVPAGSWLVRTAQPLGTLAVYLLEPQSRDGLAAWNFMDTALEVDRPFPVARVVHPDDLSREETD